VASAGHLVNLQRIGESLDRRRAEGPDRDVAFRELESVGRYQHGTGFCHLFHAGRQVQRLPDDGVIHVQIITDGTDDDVP
jgi:hypothetical protein